MKEYLKNKRAVKTLYDRFRIWSIESALKQQKLYKTYQGIDDIIGQYTTSELDTAYLQTKVRGLHAFQKKLIDLAVSGQFIMSRNVDINTVVDLGDSSGRHLEYVADLVGYSGVKYTGVNIDSEAVRRICDRGFNGVRNYIESFISKDMFDDPYDLVLMFETLEHLQNPIYILKSLNEVMGKSSRFIITVPYVRRSRVGLHHLKKRGESFKQPPEDIHLFELSPYDWGLLFEYTGWEVIYEQIYYQHPKGFCWPLKYYWRHFDFEGFYGVILKRGE